MTDKKSYCYHVAYQATIKGGHGFGDTTIWSDRPLSRLKVLSSVRDFIKDTLVKEGHASDAKDIGLVILSWNLLADEPKGEQ